LRSVCHPSSSSLRCPWELRLALGGGISKPQTHSLLYIESQQQRAAVVPIFSPSGASSWPSRSSSVRRPPSRPPQIRPSRIHRCSAGLLSRRRRGGTALSALPPVVAAVLVLDRARSAAGAARRRPTSSIRGRPSWIRPSRVHRPSIVVAVAALHPRPVAAAVCYYLPPPVVVHLRRPAVKSPPVLYPPSLCATVAASARPCSSPLLCFAAVLQQGTGGRCSALPIAPCRLSRPCPCRPLVRRAAARCRPPSWPPPSPAAAAPPRRLQLEPRRHFVFCPSGQSMLVLF